jgi:nodulation protein E
MRRVAVTGIGVIASTGNTRQSFWESLVHGKPGIRALSVSGPAPLRFQNAAEVTGYDPLEHFDAKQVDLLDRFAQFAAVSAREAIRDSGLEWSPDLKQRTAVITGCCVGGQSTEDTGFVDLYVDHKPRVNPMTIPRIMANAGASFVSTEFGLNGPVYTVSTACASANHAIGQAFWMVRSGAVEVALTGGSEAIFSYGFLKAWEAMRVVSPDTCRPFSKDRKGLILGEGGAMLVLEPLDRAVARGARIYAELAGFGMSSDAHHITQPSVDGPVMAMRAALQDSGLDPSRIGYINAHGTGTAINDVTETRAIRAVFGEHADKLAVSSTKSMTGHALGAAGAIEAAAGALAIACGVLPPTANYTTPDPECSLDVIPNQARRTEVEAVLSNAFAFGGLNAVLALRRVNSAPLLDHSGD